MSPALVVFIPIVRGQNLSRFGLFRNMDSFGLVQDVYRHNSDMSEDKVPDQVQFGGFYFLVKNMRMFVYFGGILGQTVVITVD